MLWESLWAPYDQPTYDWVLNRLEPADVILDIGAGDLRLARQMAQLVRHVYAIEIDPALNMDNRIDLPANLTLIEGMHSGSSFHRISPVEFCLCGTAPTFGSTPRN